MDDKSMEKLGDALVKLSEPSSFYYGVRTIVEPTVNNVIMFRRNHGELLNDTMQAHGRFMLVISFKGDGFTRISDRKNIHLKAGQGVLYPAHIPHRHFDMSQDHDWLFITFQADPGSFSNLHLTVFDINEQIFVDIASLVNEVMKPQTQQVKKCVILRLETILTTLSGLVAPKSKLNSGQNEFIEEVVNHVNSHIHQKISMENLAMQFGVSSAYLRQRFKKHSGISLGRFISRRRLEYAQTLLADRRISVKEVAESTGFSSFSTFCRRFKEETGLTPKEFRHRFEV